MSKLLSIVVPTKDRAEYLISLVNIFNSFKNEDMELVIQDNSSDNSVMIAFLENNAFPNIIYNYNGSKLSVVDNSNLAIKKATGKYVCFVGDDDIISLKLYDFVKCMDQYGYESATFRTAKYYWPGVEFKAHKFPNLIIENGRAKLKEVSVKKQFKKMLKDGAVDLGLMPRVYHGVVLRQRLDDVYNATSTYFPGPSPDMANSVALAHYVTKHLYCDMPLTSAGASPKSAAGLGTKHEHAGEIGKVSFLPEGTEERWNEYIPKVWTGPTIYAQSAYEALLNLKDEDSLQCFNYNAHYAFFRVFCPQYSEVLSQLCKKNNKKYNCVKFSVKKLSVFCMRVKKFIKNKLMITFGVGVRLFDGIKCSLEAGEIIDKRMADINLEKMFLELKSK